MNLQMTDEEMETWIEENIIHKIVSLDKNTRSEFASRIMHFSYEILRGIEGNDFARGFLETALKDLETNTHFIVIREPS